VRQLILDQVRYAEYFSMKADETKDTPKTEMIPFILRYSSYQSDTQELWIAMHK